RSYSTECAHAGRAIVARYACVDDYHDVIGGRLDALLSWMRHEAAEPFEARAYVDTGPVQERVYAQHAGIGWIGKNTCVINPEIGSWIFLGVIICSLPLEVDLAALDRCGTCTLCLEACPTGAIVAPGVLDSNRCISYLTIELRGDIPEAMRAAIGTHIYGCDICQEVCPWNATPPRSPDRAWQPRSVWDRVDLLTLAGCTDDELADSLRGSAMRRTRVQGLRRNIDTALGNACDPTPPNGFLIDRRCPPSARRRETVRLAICTSEARRPSSAKAGAKLSSCSSASSRAMPKTSRDIRSSDRPASCSIARSRTPASIAPRSTSPTSSSTSSGSRAASDAFTRNRTPARLRRAGRGSILRFNSSSRARSSAWARRP